MSLILIPLPNLLHRVPLQKGTAVGQFRYAPSCQNATCRTPPRGSRLPPHSLRAVSHSLQPHKPLHTTKSLPRRPPTGGTFALCPTDRVRGGPGVSLHTPRPKTQPPQAAHATAALQSNCASPISRSPTRRPPRQSFAAEQSNPSRNSTVGATAKPSPRRPSRIPPHLLLRRKSPLVRRQQPQVATPMHPLGRKPPAARHSLVSTPYLSTDARSPTPAKMRARPLVAAVPAPPTDHLSGAVPSTSRLKPGSPHPFHRHTIRHKNAVQRLLLSFQRPRGSKKKRPTGRGPSSRARCSTELQMHLSPQNASCGTEPSRPPPLRGTGFARLVTAADIKEEASRTSVVKCS